MLAGELDKIAGLYGGKLRVLKVDSDEEPRIASALKVYGLPTIFLIKVHLGASKQRGRGIAVVSMRRPLAYACTYISFHPFSRGQEGQLVHRMEGALPASELTKLINHHLFGAEAA